MKHRYTLLITTALYAGCLGLVELEQLGLLPGDVHPDLAPPLTITAASSGFANSGRVSG
jgi:hypothetical protein